MKLFVYILHIIDRFREVVILRVFGKIWLFEILLRGGIVGRGCDILGRPVAKIAPNSKFVVGKNAQINSDNRRCTSGSVYAPCRFQTHNQTSEILLGDNNGLNGTSIVSRSRRIQIGDNVMIAPNVVIMDSPFHSVELSDARANYSGNELDFPVIIGNNVWIGTGSLILGGANIGSGCVVGARSIVNKAFPDNCLIAGSPARIIRYLS